MSRNPAYYNFDAIGGDCTNFVSQCLYAGGAVMNWTKDTGWYYDTLHNRAAAWTSVHYFYQFAVNNQETGFFGREVPVQEVRAGDVIQLGTGYFHHSLFVIAVIRKMPYLAAHTADVYHVPLSAYRYDRIRCLHIIGARKQI